MSSKKKSDKDQPQQTDAERAAAEKTKKEAAAKAAADKLAADKKAADDKAAADKLAADKKAADDKAAKDIAEQNGLTSNNTSPDIMQFVMQFIQFFFGGMFGNDFEKEVPHESDDDDKPVSKADAAHSVKQMFDSKALTKWRDYQEAHKGEAVAFHSPVKGLSQVTSPFGHRHAPKAGASTEHAGLDIGARSGDSSPEILAAAKGVVLFSGRRSGYGNAVIIGHADGTTTLYGHLSGAHMPAMGTEIEQGAIVGEMGNSGNSTGPHLHFEVRKGGKAIAPVIDGVAVAKGTMLKDDSPYAGMANRDGMPKLPVADVKKAGNHNVTVAKTKTTEHTHT